MKRYILCSIFILLNTLVFSQKNEVTFAGNIKITFPGLPTHQYNPNTKDDVYLYASPEFVYIASVTPIHNFLQNPNEDLLIGKNKNNLFTGLFNTCNGKLISENTTNFKGYKCLDFNFNLYLEGTELKYGKARNIQYKTYLISFVYYYAAYDNMSYQAFLNSLNF